MSFHEFLIWNINKVLWIFITIFEIIELIGSHNIIALFENTISIQWFVSNCINLIVIDF